MKKYFTCGHVVESFTFLPSININWIYINKKRIYDVQFAWFFWYISTNNIVNELKKKD